MSDNQFSNFKVNTSNYLGFDYDEYIHKLEALALTKPSEYYKMRSRLLKELKNGIVKQTFETYFTLLTEGRVGEFEMKIDGEVVSPNYPKQDASAFAIQASKTINKILDNVMEEIMPANHLAISKIRLTKMADNTTIE